MVGLRTFLLLCLIAAAAALYEPSDDVVELTSSNFDKEVLKGSGVYIVEFYANWCGHCKNLAPEYKKAASALKGLVKVGAVDMDKHGSVGSPYGVTGFPTIKVFGGDKGKPTTYEGARTAQAIVEAALKEAQELARARVSGKKAGSSSKSSKSSSSGSSGGASKVVTLTASNFDELVMQSDDVWLVEFFAPWCGHCKNLAPHWEKAAKELDGKVKIGAVDATVESSLGSKYQIRGYPTIKVFKAGPKSEPTDYSGGRTSGDIVSYALSLAEENKPAPKVEQLVSQETLEEVCGKTSTCVVAFLPHILDSKASGRNAYLDVLGKLAAKYKNKPFAYVWAEAGQHEAFANALELGGSGYPAVAALNFKKGRFANYVGTITEQGLSDWMRDVLSGKVKTLALPNNKVPAVEKVSAWDGKDGQLPQDDSEL